jgi:hypothetical protein
MFIGEMNLGLSGHTYTSHDFTDQRPAGIHWSLLGPWMPGALTSAPQGDIPGIRLNRDDVPEDALRARMCQFYLKLRYRLIPYIYSTHWQAHTTGAPYMRAMVLEDQDDPVTYKLDHQCMLGDWFLLAAYTNDVYLPAGKWFDYWTYDEYESSGEWRKNHKYPDNVGGPLLVKGGAIIPMGPVMAYVDKEPMDIVVLDIYPHGTSEFTLYEDDGTSYDYESGAFSATKFSCSQTGKDILIHIGKRKGSYKNMPESRSFFLSLHCRAEPSTIFKGTQILTRHATKEDLVSDGAKKGWYYDKKDRIAWVKPMAGWHYSADERGDGDPEKDTVNWIESGKHEEGEFSVSIKLMD